MGVETRIVSETLYYPSEAAERLRIGRKTLMKHVAAGDIRIGWLPVSANAGTDSVPIAASMAAATMWAVFMSGVLMMIERAFPRRGVSMSASCTG